jgi:NAD(P)-dependent dehydrogenase (short-subunit alcohol dehydrogenase family)
MRFRGKTAIVTGVGHGIGRAIALRLAGEGAQLVAVDVNQATLAETAETVRDAGGRVLGPKGS